MRARLESFARQVLGPCKVEADCGWDHGGALVLRLRDREGTAWYAKQNPHHEVHAREVSAYRRWVPHLGDRAPKLRAATDDLPALVISAVPGVAFTGDDVEVHGQAGRLLRRFHEIETFPPWTDLVAHKLAEVDAWVARANGLFDRPELDFVRSTLRSLEGIPAPPRVSCHFDYSPRNWLVDEGRVYLIDFEWAQPEVWVNDLGRLFFGLWRTRPDLREAFLDGYGRQPDEADLALLLGSYALTTVWHIVWTHEHGNHEFGDAVRQILHGLMRGEYGKYAQQDTRHAKLLR
ncbi:phosphotransferase [Actinopolymorpha sp. B11F2]|uniref:phosphotransferase enzyme family protein n=1 Tax=Actinopolymorpha sp. B11F2 TaxID=3160862 RepID=UPI0032E4A5BE